MAQIYLISPEDFDLSTHKERLEIAFATGRIAAFQLRLKNKSDEQIEQIALQTMQICQKYNVLFVLNDNFEIAIKVKAGGVHLGIDDYESLAEIKKNLPENFIIGTSCYDSRDLALDSVLADVDYISFGAFYTSKTKKSRGQPDISILKWANEIFELPIVAIGGINDSNAKILAQSGADFVAIISYFWDHEDPKKAIETLHQQIS